MSDNKDLPPPRKIGLLLFPGFMILDAFGPMDVLNVLSTMRKIDLYVIASSLTPITNKTLRPYFGSNFYQTIVPTHTFETVPDDLEVLFVPGGEGAEGAEEVIEPYLKFLREVKPKLRYLLSVCNGASLLARAGLLDGRRATTNKAYYKYITAQRPSVNWLSHARWVDDGDIWTASGVTAGIDMTLEWVGKLYPLEGENPLGVEDVGVVKSMAERIANVLEHKRTEDWRDDPFAGLYGLE